MTGKPHKIKVLPLRRLVQILVLLILVAIPYLSQNPSTLAPSRIVLGNQADPSLIPVMGDTWSFSLGNFRLTHPVAFLEEVLSSKSIYLPFFVSVLIPLALTVALGRVFCSWICPVGYLLELNQKLNRVVQRAGLHFNIRVRDYRYPILTISLIFGFLFAVPVISVFDPPHLFSRELMYIFTHNAVSLSGVGLLLGIFLFETFSTSRAWCNSICPSGAGLALMSVKRALWIKMESEACNHCSKCDGACPYYLEPMGLADKREFDWNKCDNCGLCRDVCPAGAISFSSRRS